MKKQRLVNNGGHFLLLQLLWPAAVLGAAAGVTWPGVLLFAAMLGWSAIRGLGVRADMRLALSGVLVGILFELLLIGGGLIEYRLQPAAGLPPLWILTLWAGFSLNIRHCMQWFCRHPLMGAVFGLLGAPFSVIAGVSLGAATAPLGPVHLGVAYGLGWALAMPLLSLLAVTTEAPGREGDDRSVVA